MNRETQSIEKKRHIPLWNTKKVVKKDILLIPAYIFFQSIIPIIDDRYYTLKKYVCWYK